MRYTTFHVVLGGHSRLRHLEIHDDEAWIIATAPLRRRSSGSPTRCHRPADAQRRPRLVPHATELPPVPTSAPRNAIRATRRVARGRDRRWKHSHDRARVGLVQPPTADPRVRSSRLEQSVVDAGTSPGYGFRKNPSGITRSSMVTSWMDDLPRPTNVRSMVIRKDSRTS